MALCAGYSRGVRWGAKYICLKTRWSLRNNLTDNDLDTVLFQKITDTLAKVFKVDMTKQRIDSVHIKSNMRRLGRIGLLVRCLHIHLRYDRKAVRLAQRRAREETPEFRDRYRFRAGIEGTISAYEARTGVKWLRVRGLQAVRFCATLKAAGVNLFRATAVRRALMQGPVGVTSTNL